jgi:hypothetical protein
MADRQALAGELAIARAMEVATMPVTEHEPAGESRQWAFGISATLMSAWLASDEEKRDLVVLAGARILGWLEALDDA